MTLNELIAMATSEAHRVPVAFAWEHTNDKGTLTKTMSFYDALSTALPHWPDNRMAEADDYHAIFGAPIEIARDELSCDDWYECKSANDCSC